MLGSALVLLLMIFLVVGLTVVYYPSFAQPDDSITFRAKGIVTGEHFTGGVMWTMIEENQATTITQWSLGRSLIHSSVVPIACEPGYSICLEATIVESHNSAAAKPGDIFTIKIDPENKRQIIVGKLGFLENTEIVLGLDKIHSSQQQDVSSEDTRPNILVIVLDDTGFADYAFSGSEIPTPNLDSLRNEGKLFTNFHTAPTCSPTRAMLMTGVDNHLNGLGTMVEGMAENQKGMPGYEGFLNDNVVTIPQLLLDNGYHTYMTGKWHLAYGSMDPTGNWEGLSKNDPYNRGFEETFSVELPGSHFANVGVGPGHVPIATKNGQIVEYPQQYIDDVFTDYMIEFIDKNHEDGKPMFMYLAFWNNHWPIQAPQEYLEKYEGVYDEGWDKIREKRFERQKELGLIPNDVTLSPRHNAVPAWDSLNATQQKQEAKKMEIFAAMLDSIDNNVGRVVVHLKETGEYDNTMIFVFADNGAEANDPSKKVAHDPGLTEQDYQNWLNAHFNNDFENWGNGDSLVGIGLGWAQVGNTPLSREKMYQTEGGTRVPMIVKFTEDIRESSSDAFTRVSDISLTILDYAQIQNPGTTYSGKTIHAMDGKSLRPILESTTQEIYGDDEPVGAELFGNSALYKGDWKASRHISPFGDGEWKLYHLTNDLGEQNDLSEQFPDVLSELIKDYDDYAQRVGVIPPIGLELQKH